MFFGVGTPQNEDDSLRTRQLNGPLILRNAWLAVLPHKKITSLVAATRSVIAFTAKSCKTCRTCKSSVGRSLSFLVETEVVSSNSHRFMLNWIIFCILFIHFNSHKTAKD